MSDISIILKAILEKNSKERILKEVNLIQEYINKSPLKFKIDINNDEFRKFSANMNELTAKLGIAFDKVSKQSVSTTFIGGVQKSRTEVEQLTNSYGDLIKVTNKYQEGKETLTKIDASSNYEKQRIELEKLNAEQSKYWSNRVKETVSNITAKPDELVKMASYYKQMAVEADKADTQEKQRIATYEKLNAELTKLKENALSTNAVLKNFGKEKQHQKADELTSSLQKLNITQNMTQKEMQETVTQGKLLSNQLNNVSREAKSTGNNSMTMGKMISTAFEKFSIWISVTTLFFGTIRAIKSAASEVVSLNTAVTELNKVLEVSSDELLSYTEKAYKLGETLGRTGKEVITATAEFAKAGYNLQQSSQLAEQALLLTNVADGLNDTAEAAGYLIAVMKGYNLTADDTVHIVDLLNEVSNNYAVNTLKLAEGLQRTSGTLSQTNTSVEELTGILTGGYEVLRNMEKVSAGLITISTRLRGVTESGEEIDGLMPKLQEKFQKFAGIDVQTTNGELRSTFEILQDLAGVWSTLNDEQRSEISFLTSGMRQSPVLNAIMLNWQNVEAAVETALNSTNSAIKENEKYMASLEGRINLLNSALSKLAYDTINSGLFGSLINLATGFVKIIDKVGILNLAIAGLITYFSVFKTSLLLVPIINAATLAISKLTIGLNLSATAAIRLNTALGMLAPLAIALGIMAIVSAIDKANKKIDEFINNTEDQLIKQKEQMQQLEDLKSRYEKITKSTDDYKKKEEELYRIKEDLVRINPTIIKGIQGETDAHRNLGIEIGNTINKENEYHALFVKNKKIEALANIEILNKQIAKKREQIAKGEEDIALLEQQRDEGGIIGWGIGWASKKVLPDNATVTNKKINELEDLNEKLKETQRILDILDGKEDVKSVNTPPNINDPFTSTIVTPGTGTPPTPKTFNLYETALAQINYQIDELQDKLSSATTPSEINKLTLDLQVKFNLKEDLIKRELIDVNNQLESAYASLPEQYRLMIKSGFDVKDITVTNEKLANLIETTIKLRDEQYKLGKELRDVSKEFDNINTSVKKIIDTSLKSVIDSLSKDIKSLQKEQKDVTEAMQQSLDAYEKSQQAKIDKHKEELELLEEQYEVEDRLKKIQEINDEIAKVRADTRFQYINQYGEVEYTYNKEKYNELVEQREELLAEYKRKDIIQAKKDEIKALEDATKKEIQRQKDEIEATKKSYEIRIENYNNFKDTLSDMQNMELADLRSHIDSKIAELKRYEEAYAQHQTTLTNVQRTISVGTQQQSSSSYPSTSDHSSFYNDIVQSSDDASVAQARAELLDSMGIHHKGLDSGFAGNIPFDPKTETLAKLMKGKEVVFTKAQFDQIVPNIFSSLIPKIPQFTPINRSVGGTQNTYYLSNFTIKSNDAMDLFKQINHLAIAHTGS